MDIGFQSSAVDLRSTGPALSITHLLSRPHIPVLIVDGSASDAERTKQALSVPHTTFSTRQAGSWEDFLVELDARPPRVVVCEHSIGARTALDVVRRIVTEGRKAVCLVMTDHEPDEVVLGALRAGAAEFLPKSNRSLLPGVILRAMYRFGAGGHTVPGAVPPGGDTGLVGTIFDAYADLGAGWVIVEADSLKLLRVSRAFCALAGREAAVLLKLPSILSLVHPSDRGRMNARIRAIRRFRPVRGSFTVTLDHPDRGAVRVEAAVRAFHAGDTRAYVMAGREITERTMLDVGLRGAPSILRVDEISLRRIVEEGGNLAVIRLDSAGRITEWNRGVERLFGYRAREILGESFEVLLSREGESVPFLDTGLQSAMARGTAVGEIGGLRKDRTAFPARVVVGVLRNGSSRPVGFLLIIRDLSPRHGRDELLERKSEELGALARHLQGAREEERLRMARELHDELSQVLTAFRMDLSILGQKVGKTVPAAVRRPIVEKIAEMSQLTEQTIRSVRNIISELRPAALDEFGITTAIQWHAQEFEKRTGIRCMISRLQRNLDVGSEQGIALFRILQEALTNVGRHAGATRVELSFGLEQGGELVLRISDNGSGIPAGKSMEGNAFGLLGMRERANILGGTVELRSEAGKGTTVTVRIPAAPSGAKPP